MRFMPNKIEKEIRRQTKKTSEEPIVITPPPPCIHKFVYGGVRYVLSDCPWPGGGYLRHYHDWFYCEKCLENRYKPLNATDDSNQPLKFNAVPQ